MLLSVKFVILSYHCQARCDESGIGENVLSTMSRIDVIALLTKKEKENIQMPRKNSLQRKKIKVQQHCFLSMSNYISLNSNCKSEKGEWVASMTEVRGKWWLETMRLSDGKRNALSKLGTVLTILRESVSQLASTSLHSWYLFYPPWKKYKITHILQLMKPDRFEMYKFVTLICSSPK